ncbi:MAG: aspartate aminotransferase family protein [Lentisphaeria bacterium]
MEPNLYHEIMADHQQYVLGTYAPGPLLERGAMSWVWDHTGKRYLDCAAGISVCNLGHCHPRVTEAIQRQAAKLVHVSNLYLNENQPRLAARIAKHSFGGRVFFCNSGAEANEGMIKFARKWGHEQGRHEIVCMAESFHGRTLATLAATGRAKYRQDFAPDLAGFVHVPLNDLAAVQAALTPRTAAVLVEPIQGEGGIRVASREFLAGLRQLCDERGLLLLLDEIQCGMGRTGLCFAYQHYGIVPDAMSLAKALGNGIPIGAFTVQQKYQDLLPPGTHGSTFGGNPLACAAGLAVFDALEQDGVLENTRRMGTRFLEQLTALGAKHPCIREIRGMGLMLGLDVGQPVTGLLAAARDRGLLILAAGETVLRLLPPLTIQPDEVDLACRILDEILPA